MPECSRTSRTVRFWKLARHYICSDTSKLWRSNAETLIQKLCPCDFDIGQLDSSCTRHVLELAWILQNNESCRRFIQSTISSFMSSPRLKPMIKEDVTFTFTCLRIMTCDGAFDTSSIGTRSLFEFCATCYNASEAFKSMSVAAWITCCRAVHLEPLLNYSEGAELLIQTPVDKVSGWCKVDESLINASFRVGCPDILVECISHVPQSVKMEIETIQPTWFMLVALSCNPHLINGDHLDMASSIAKLYFDKNAGLPSSLEHLKLDLEGKTLEKLLFPSLEVLRHSTNRVPINLDLDSWHWVQYRPKVFKAFARYIVTHPSTDITKLCKTFGRHKMWWDILATHLPRPELYLDAGVEYAPTSLDFLWKTSAESITDRIPPEMLVDYLVGNDIALPEDSMARQVLQSEKVIALFDQPSEKFLKFLANNRIDLSDKTKERLYLFAREIAKDGDNHRFRNFAPLIWQMGIDNNTLKDFFIQASREDQRLSSLVDDDLYSALMDSLDHDHTNVVGYRSCTAECYCD